MKRYILAVFLTLTLSINAFALSPLPIEDQISYLRAEIARLTALVRQLGGDPTPELVLPHPIFCYEFEENFTPGDGHPDWTKLGEVLKLEGVSTVKELQEKYEADILRPAGLRLGTGYVGSLTRAKLNALYRCQPPVDNNLPPSISGVTGSTVLKIGELGSWTVNASDPENGSLNYSVHWGDEPLSSAEVGTTPSVERVYNQTATLTHTYSRAGTYYPKFWVRDNAGNTQWTSLSVNVTAGNVARVTVTSPNGGEVWESYSIQPIKWKVNDRNIKKVDLYLQPVMPSCSPGLSCIQVMPDPIVLDKNISAGLTYNWIVGTDIVNNVIPAGKFWLSVCPAGSDSNYDEGCDESNNTFTIRNISIVEATSRGGYCAAPGCVHPVFSIQANGDWMYLQGANTLKQGKLTSAEVSELTSKISSTNFTAIKASLFTGTCPVAYDGTESIYTFRLGSTNETLYSCTYNISLDHPLFDFVDNLFDDIAN